MGEPATRASAAAAVGAVLALPTVVAILVPPVLVAVDPWRPGVWPWGLAVFGVGAFVVVRTVLDFFMVGGGTLAPWDSPRRLLTVGLFGVCRNPMYVGVITTVAGWATTFRSPTVAAYACVLAAVFHLRVIRFEEPWAEQSFPDTWPTYRERVPRWFPRLRRR